MRNKVAVQAGVLLSGEARDNVARFPIQLAPRRAARCSTSLTAPMFRDMGG
jgi:hypothetical protein